MFGKLLKYELKSIGKWYVLLNIAILAISTALGLIIKGFVTDARNTENFSYSLNSKLLPLSLVFILAALIMGAWIATLFIIINRFNKNIFGREGYLTLTLPVSTHQIILSKLVAALIWNFFISLIIFLGLVLVFLPSIGLGKVLVALPQFTSYLPNHIAIWGLVYAFLSSISGTLLIYLAISIGQLFSNRRGLMGFVAYFALSVILAILSTHISNHILVDNEIFTEKFFIFYCIQDLIVSLIYYSGTYYIIKRKLNIQ